MGPNGPTLGPLKVKDIAGASYKIKQKRQKRRQSVAAGRQQYCAVQSRSPIIVKRRPKKCSLQLAMERRQRRWHGALLTDEGRLFHARAETTGNARSPSVERLVDGTTSMAESAERSRRRVSTLDFRGGPGVQRQRDRN